MGPSVIAMLPEVRLNTLILGQHAPIPLPRPRLFGYRIARSALPRERFSRVPSMFDSLGVEVPCPT
jgi:hypothetical protein